jgi:hypothetical protein
MTGRIRPSATREWLTRYDDLTGTTEDFQAVCEEASGQDLDSFRRLGADAEQADDLVTPSPGRAQRERAHRC